MKGRRYSRRPVVTREERSLTVAIESIAAGGDGIGRAEGLAVFVPRTAPGDVARVTAAMHGRMARGIIETLEVPAPGRIQPPCEHYVVDRCGGCQLQHISYHDQLSAKRRIVSDAFTRIARRDTTVPPVRASSAEWRYRRKLTLALRRRANGWLAGLHPYDDPSAVFDLRDCPITDERVVAAWREIMAAAEDLPNERELRGAVRLTDLGPTFELQGGEQWAARERFIDRTPSIVALWWKRGTSAPRLVHDRRLRNEPGASFMQVNPRMAESLHAYVTDRVLEHRPRTVIDAYAGTGETAVRIARAGAHVQAIELDADAARYCASRLPAGSTSVSARVEDVIASALPADIVLLNPPRTGVDERVAQAIASASAPVVVYVSCNPATLARDVARLPGHRVARVQSFDMFPQTAHVETVCELVREAA